MLENAGLIQREVDAQWRLCRLRPQALQQAHGWLEHYAEHWERSLDRLTDYLESPQPAAPPAKSTRRRKRP